MKFPIQEIISNDKNKYEISIAMIKYGIKLDEMPELLLEYNEKDKDKRLKIIMSDILSSKVKYTYNK